MIKILLSILLLYASTALAMNVAVDDIPANGALPPHLSRLEVANTMLKVLNRHHIQGVYGLMNGNGLVNSAEGLAVAKEWLQSGQLLGNHTFVYKFNLPVSKLLRLFS